MNEIEFRGLVKAMLDAQAVYFKSRKPSDLITAKKLESQVRKELAADPNNASSFSKPDQPGLFDESDKGGFSNE